MATSNDALAAILQSAVEDGGEVRITREDFHVLRLYAQAKWPGRQTDRDCPYEHRHQLEKYVRERVAPGEFLLRVLENDVHAALRVAGRDDAFYLQAVVAYITRHLPGSTFGTPAIVENHLKRGNRADWTPPE